MAIDPKISLSSSSYPSREVIDTAESKSSLTESKEMKISKTTDSAVKALHLDTQEELELLNSSVMGKQILQIIEKTEKTGKVESRSDLFKSIFELLDVAKDCASKNLEFSPEVIKIPVKEQQDFLKKVLDKWTTFPKEHGGLELRDVSFLKLEDFIELSLITLFVTMKKKSNTKHESPSFIRILNLLTNRKWQDEKLLATQAKVLFKSFVQELNLSKEEIIPFEKHLNILILLARQQECYSLPLLNISGSPTFESRHSILLYMNKLISSMSHALAPTFHISCKKFSDYLKNWESTSESLKHSLALKKIGGKLENRLQKILAISKVFRLRLEALQLYSEGRLSELQKLCQALPLSRELHPSEQIKQIDELLLLGKRFDTGMERTSELLKTEFTNYGCWLVLFSGVRGIEDIPEIKHFTKQSYGTLQKLLGDIYTNITNDLQEFIIDNTEMMKTETLEKKLNFIEVYQDLLTVMADFIDSKYLGGMPMKKLTKKLGALQQNWPKSLCQFSEFLLASLDKACEKYKIFSLKCWSEFQEICPHGGRIDFHGNIVQDNLNAVKTSLLKNATLKINVEKTPLENIYILIYILKKSGQRTYQSAELDSCIQLILKNTRETTESIYTKLYGKMGVIYRDFNDMTGEDLGKMIDQLSVMRQASRLMFQTLFPILEQCRHGITISAPEGPIADEEELWLSLIDQEESYKASGSKRDLEENTEIERKESDSKLERSETKAPSKKTGHKKSKGSTTSKSTPSSLSSSRSLTSAPSSLLSTFCHFDSQQSQFLSALRNNISSFHGIKQSIISPYEMCGKDLSLSQLSLNEQLYAFDCLNWNLEMIEHCPPEIEQETLLMQFFHWGYLSLEQGLTSEYLKEGTQDSLIHNLEFLLHALEISRDNQWVIQNNKGTLYARYPYSCINYRNPKNDPAVLKFIVNSGSKINKTFLKEFSDGSRKWLHEAGVIKCALLEEPTPSQVIPLKTIKTKLTEFSQDKPILALAIPEKEKCTLATLQVSKLDAIAKILTETEEALQKIIGLYSSSPEYPVKKIKMLKNTWHHLQNLCRIPQLVKYFPEVRFILAHSQSALIATQYLAENIGTYLSMENDEDMRRHDLRMYGVCYGMNDPLSENQLKILDSINVAKGSEYPHHYFHKTPKKYISKLMEQLSEFYVRAKTATIAGEGFSPPGIKEKSTAILQQELVNLLTDLSDLANALVQNHLLKEKK